MKKKKLLIKIKLLQEENIKLHSKIRQLQAFGLGIDGEVVSVFGMSLSEIAELKSSQKKRVTCASCKHYEKGKYNYHQYDFISISCAKDCFVKHYNPKSIFEEIECDYYEKDNC